MPGTRASRGWQATASGTVLSLLVAVVCLLLAACGPLPGFGRNDPPLPAGWSWYHDARFPYQSPVPPGWQTVAFNDWTYGTPRDCVRKAFFLPPGSHTEAEFLSPTPRVPEYILIETMVDCPEWSEADAQEQPLGTLQVSGTSASFYGDEIEGVNFIRQAVTHFGGHQYLLSFRYDIEPPGTPAERLQHDLDGYMQVLQGFKYTGK